MTELSMLCHLHKDRARAWKMLWVKLHYLVQLLGCSSQTFVIGWQVNLKLDFRSYCFQHAAILDLDGDRSTSFFGVYDGHGGLFFILVLLQHTETFHVLPCWSCDYCTLNYCDLWGINQNIPVIFYIITVSSVSFLSSDTYWRDVQLVVFITFVLI